MNFIIFSDEYHRIPYLQSEVATVDTAWDSLFKLCFIEV